MKRKKRIISAILTLSMVVSTGRTIFALDNKVNDSKVTNNNELRLWYDAPAEDRKSTIK